MRCTSCQAEILDDSRFCSNCGTPSNPSDDTPTRTLIRGPVAELAPGTTLAGKFKILEGVGQGGMGVVYKAEDTKLQRLVALKFLPPQLSSNRVFRERFLTEARAAAALSHPNICTVHEIHDQGDDAFLEMEYVEGQTLTDRIREGPLEPDEAVAITIQVADALEAAHRRGVIHRDIKSPNVMVTAQGQAKVMDFGLAQVRGETLHTKPGTLLGTVAYMSPEQAGGSQSMRGPTSGHWAWSSTSCWAAGGPSRETARSRSSIRS